MDLDSVHTHISSGLCRSSSSSLGSFIYLHVYASECVLSQQWTGYINKQWKSSTWINFSRPQWRNSRDPRTESLHNSSSPLHSERPLYTSRPLSLTQPLSYITAAALVGARPQKHPLKACSQWLLSLIAGPLQIKSAADVTARLCSVLRFKSSDLNKAQMLLAYPAGNPFMWLENQIDLNWSKPQITHPEDTYLKHNQRSP